MAARRKPIVRTAKHAGEPVALFGPRPEPARTLRDELAMAAVGSIVLTRQPRDGPRQIANMAYQVADAMLAEREESPESQMRGIAG